MAQVPFFREGYPSLCHPVGYSPAPGDFVMHCRYAHAKKDVPKRDCCLQHDMRAAVLEEHKRSNESLRLIQKPRLCITMSFLVNVALPVLNR